jgi:MOSC domain-containing protein YiiM
VSGTEEGEGRVAAIHLAPASRLPMRSVDAALAEEGRGLVGDRYHGTRHRHVTLQAASALADAGEVLGRPVSWHLTRRNVTVTGLGAVPTAPGTRVQVGEALLEVVRVAAPCRLLDDTIGAGAQEALRRRGGSVLRVLRTGTVRVGDPVTVLPATAR